MAASKRMFSMQIIDSDDFLDMPLSTQALYFHLSMRADDDGFLNNSKKIMRMTGCNQNDYDLLVMKSFVIEFPDGICVIKHWRINNYLRKDRYTETVYKEEKAMLSIKENGAYTLGSGNPLPGIEEKSEAPQSPVEEEEEPSEEIPVSEPKGTKTKRTQPQKHKHGEYKHVLLTDAELEKLRAEFGADETDAAIAFLDEYIEMKGYKAKSHYLCMRKWVYMAVKEQRIRQKRAEGTQGAAAQPKKNKFNNFQQRDYDWDCLEKLLMLPDDAPAEERERLFRMAEKR